MKKYSVVLFIAFFAVTAFIISCNNSNNQETILKGKVAILVDESIQPIVEDVQAVFEGVNDDDGGADILFYFIFHFISFFFWEKH